MTEMNEVRDSLNRLNATPLEVTVLKQKLKELQRDYERLDYEQRVLLDDIERLKDEYEDGMVDMRSVEREMDDVENQLSEYGE